MNEYNRNDYAAPMRGLVIALLLSGPAWVALFAACALVWRVIGGAL